MKTPREGPSDAKAAKEQRKSEAGPRSPRPRRCSTRPHEPRLRPEGKGTQADLAALKGDLDGVATAIADAEAALNGEKYIDAKAKADGAKQTIQNVTASIEQAKAAKAGRR